MSAIATALSSNPLQIQEAASINQPHPITSQLDRLLSLLKSPHPLTTLKLLHAHIIKTGFTTNDLVFGQLLLCCSISNSMDYARSVFDAIHPSPKPFFYNAMLKGYSHNGANLHALRLYGLMRSRSVRCDSFTLTAVLRSASDLGNVQVGREVHGLALKIGSGPMLIVQTAVMDAYCNFGLPGYARSVFDGILAEKDVICWNTMLAGYVKCGEYVSAKELFDEMPTRNVSSWNTVVDMYCKIGDMQTARNLFDEMPGPRDHISWNALISGYAKIGKVEETRSLFDLMPERNVVSWNVMISCYVHSRRFNEALELFRVMQVSETKPNEVTVVAILPTCAHLGALDMGQWIHAYVGRHGIKMDVYVTTALVDMYGKCGSVEEARRVFEAAPEKDCYLCGTMIEVFAVHGRAEEAFRVFEYMARAKIKPNDVTFVGLLRACAHVGLVDSGRKCFRMMKDEFGLEPKAEHFGCFVDLLGRGGLLEEALQVIENMSMEPHPIVWASLLSACRLHGDVRRAEEVALRLIEMEPESCANYVLLSNIYTKAGRWEDAASIRKIMKIKGVAKKPGCSSIELDNSVHEFFAGDRSHPDCDMVYKMLDVMVTRLKREGYVPKASNSVLHDVDDEGQERAVIHHSEKLAVAFALISDASKVRPLRIVKNLRVCDDCHTFLKLASKCYSREMIVRDCNRFHHFVDGYCSCSDYW